MSSLNLVFLFSAVTIFVGCLILVATNKAKNPWWSWVPLALVGTLLVFCFLMYAAVSLVVVPFFLIYVIIKAVWGLGEKMRQSREEYKSALFGGLIIFLVITPLMAVVHAWIETWSKFFVYLGVYGTIFFLLFVVFGPIYEVFHEPNHGNSAFPYDINRNM